MEKDKDYNYWKNRHLKYSNTLKSVGCKSFSERANKYSYRLVRERYDKLLNSLALSDPVEIIDVGAGIGLYLDLFVKRQWRVTATDISPEAINGIKKKRPNVQTVVAKITELNFPNQKFNIVNCFDVLLHILDEEEWENSIKKLCAISKRYVILHGMFFKKSSGFTAWHVRHRDYDKLTEEFRLNGMTEIKSIRTHAVAINFPYYYLRNLFPFLFYFIDKNLIKNRPSNVTYAIKVFERQ